MINNKVLLPRAKVILSKFGNPIQSLWFYCSQRLLNKLAFQYFRFDPTQKLFNIYSLKSTVVCYTRLLKDFFDYVNCEETWHTVKCYYKYLHIVRLEPSMKISSQTQHQRSKTYNVVKYHFLTLILSDLVATK